MDQLSGETPAVEKPSTQAPPAEGVRSPDEPEEEHFDLEPAMRTINALRQEAKQAKAQLKELESLRAEREAVRQAQLSKEEQLAQELERTRAERDFAIQEKKDAVNRQRVMAEAQRLVAVDPAAVYRLLDRDQVEYDDEGEPTNVSKAVESLLKNRPDLHTATSFRAFTRTRPRGARTYVLEEPLRGFLCPNRYSSSKPWDVNLRVRPFSVTVRTTWSGAPSGMCAAMSSVTSTCAPRRATRCCTISSAMRPASRARRSGSSFTEPW